MFNLNSCSVGNNVLHIHVVAVGYFSMNEDWSVELIKRLLLRKKDRHFVNIRSGGAKIYKRLGC